jgi:hypothetical protein
MKENSAIDDTCGTAKTSESEEDALEGQLEALREMIDLLKRYEEQCIRNVDLPNAKETRGRIKMLTGKEEELEKHIFALKQEKEVKVLLGRPWL